MNLIHLSLITLLHFLVLYLFCIRYLDVAINFRWCFIDLINLCHAC
jgi:hypothetical protein